MVIRKPCEDVQGGFNIVLCVRYSVAGGLGGFLGYCYKDAMVFCMLSNMVVRVFWVAAMVLIHQTQLI